MIMNTIVLALIMFLNKLGEVGLFHFNFGVVLNLIEYIQFISLTNAPYLISQGMEPNISNKTTQQFIVSLI